MENQQLSHYQILGKLGQGGMGIVYQARDLHLDRLVAVKILPPAVVADAGRRQRFSREARAASALNHPNIVTIYDIAQSDGVDFISMEYVDGHSLEARLAQGPMPIDAALDTGEQIAAA